jgi:hypothetical protein
MEKWNSYKYSSQGFYFKVADCDFVAAQLPLSAVFCDDFNVSFANQTPTPLIYSWHWDFGMTGT